MLNFEPLASSSNGCCYHLSGGGASAPILIEAGVRFARIQEATGFKVTGLAGCLISHAHGDHAFSTDQMVAAGVDCYASKETWDALHAKKRPITTFRRHVVEEEKQFQVGDWQVVAFAAVHDAPGTLGFLVGSPSGHVLLYLTDSAYTRKTFPGVTHIAAEANYSSELLRKSLGSGAVHPGRANRTVTTHMSIERLLDLLAANDLSKCEEIWLLHLSADNSDAEDFKRQVRRATGKPTFVAPEGRA